MNLPDLLKNNAKWIAQMHFGCEAFLIRNAFNRKISDPAKIFNSRSNLQHFVAEFVAEMHFESYSLNPHMQGHQFLASILEGAKIAAEVKKLALNILGLMSKIHCPDFAF